MSSSTPTTIALPTGTWEADHTHSFAAFAIRAVGTFRGSFERVKATLIVDQDGQAELAGSVSADSVQVKNDQLKAHLGSADFFAVEAYPELRFRSTSLSSRGAEVNLVGELTIRDQTRPVQARGTMTEPVRALNGDVRFGLSLSTVIDRTNYGVSWNVALPSGHKVLGDDVTITVDLDFVLTTPPS
jgi:polyisoprenoid-binding protein YceI